MTVHERMKSEGSPSRIAWRKFRRNPIGVAASLFILFILLIALIGYHLTPDPTPHANRQILEISMQKPGFTANMLKVMNNVSSKPLGFLDVMFFGKRDVFTLYPFTDYRFSADSIYIKTFDYDAESSAEELGFLLADVCFPLNEVLPAFNGHEITFEHDDAQYGTVDLKLLQEKTQKEHFLKKRYLLGTDQYGRDMLSRLIIGSRVSLAVGFIAVFISLIIGITVGSIGGYFRGRTDDFVVWLINVVWSIPTLLLVIAITFALGKGFWQVFVAVGLTMWVEVARVVRGQMISLREKEFTEAARALGFSDIRIILKHLLPNLMSAVIVISAANFASAILIEAGLSFLGLGVQPPIPSWGSMIKENYAFIILDSAYLAILPGLAIMLLVLSFMLIGNALRDALDVKG